jgi:hypothetical protein
MELGSGTLLACTVEGASCEPNTESSIPGAYTCLKEAALVSPPITGVPLETDPVD